MVLYSSTNPYATTHVPAITYVFVGVTSFVLAYFTAMDKGEESENAPSDESATSMLPGFGEDTSANAQSEPVEVEAVEASEVEAIEAPVEPVANPVSGGKKHKKTITKKGKKTKRSTRSRVV